MSRLFALQRESNLNFPLRIAVENALEVSGYQVNIDCSAKAHSCGAYLHPGGNRLGLGLRHRCRLFQGFLYAEELVPPGTVYTAPPAQFDTQIIFCNKLPHGVRIVVEHLRKGNRVGSIGVYQVLG